MKKISTTAFLYILAVSVGYSQCWLKIAAGNDTSIALTSNHEIINWGWTDQLSPYTTTPTKRGNDLNWESVSNGDTPKFFIKQNGTLWFWGNNLYGQSGSGSNNPSNFANLTQIGTDSDWLKVSAEIYSVHAIKNNGTLWAWGVNNNGQLGDSTYSDSYIPIQIGTDTDWANLSSSFNHTIALKSDGTLWAWGKNYHGVLGLTGIAVEENVLSPTQIGNDSNWEQIATNMFTTFALKTDGTIWSWGLIDATDIMVPNQIGNESDWNQITMGMNHYVALKTDGTLWTWGKNDYGQLGDGTYIANTVPNQLGTDTWSMISAGGYYSLAVKSDGTLWSWGSNAYGQLGDGTTVDKNTPLLINCPTLSNAGISLSHPILFTPNPVVNVITLSEDSAIANYEVVTITDLHGKLIYQTAEIQKQINIEKLAKGLYFLKIKTKDGKLYREKFIKE